MSHLTESGRRLAAAAVVAMVVAAAVGVSSRQADVVLSGRVIDAVTGAAVPEAVVTVAAGATQMVEVGTNGQFTVSLTGPAVRVRMFANAPGYLRAYPAQRGPADTLAGNWSLEPEARQKLEEIVIRLWRGASMSGTVVDENRQPVVAASVFVMTRVYTGTGYRWNEAPVSSPRTDDRGRFVVAQLQPGEYLVAVRPPVDPRAGADALAPVTYYPGTQVAAAAQVLSLTSGAQATVDFTVDFRGTLSTVRGRLVGTDDFTRFVVHLVPENLAGERAMLAPINVAMAGAPFGGIGGGVSLGASAVSAAVDGSFEFSAVPPGSYRLRTWRFPTSDVRVMVTGDFQRSMWAAAGPAPSAQALTRTLPGAPAGTTWVADVPVVVDEVAPARLINVDVPLSQGARIRGRVELAGTKPISADEVAAVPVFVRPADGAGLGGVPQGRIEADGAFASVGLPPGDYVIGLGQWTGRPAGWNVTSVLHNGREWVAGAVSLGAADIENVVITLSDRTTTLAGSLRDSRGQPASYGRLIVFPQAASERDQFHAQPARRRVAQVPTDRHGQFLVQLPAGDYFVAPVTGDLPVFWMAPDHLATLVGLATAVRATEGRETRVNVTVR